MVKEAFETKEEAIKVAEDKGCAGYHEHEVEGGCILHAL